jgi:alpha-beta hydrolase superfamily lysophospholipase
VVLDYAQRFETQAAGAILSAPALYQGSGLNPVAVRLAEIMSLAVPRIKLVTLPAATLSHDPAVAQSYQTDPLIYTERVTARTAAELLRASKMIISRLDRVQIPLFIAHGTDDDLIDPASSVVIYDRAASNDKTLQLYENYAHEIMNESERERVFKDITMWLEARI